MNILKVQIYCITSACLVIVLVLKLACEIQRDKDTKMDNNHWPCTVYYLSPCPYYLIPTYLVQLFQCFTTVFPFKETFHIGRKS